MYYVKVERWKKLYSYSSKVLEREKNNFKTCDQKDKL